MHCKYGVAYVDLSMDTFYLGCLEDDTHRTQLNTLIHSIHPSEVIIEKGQHSPITKKLVQVTPSTPVREIKTSTDMIPKDYTGFPTAEAARHLLGDLKHVTENPIVQQFYQNDLVMSSFGSCLYYMKYVRMMFCNISNNLQ